MIQTSFKGLLDCKQIVLALILGITITSLQALSSEEDITNNWGLRAGWTQTLMSDQHASPLLYQANSLNNGS